ncbi:MAG: Hpt domain-containing protein [Candidatus Krumholzibacteriia bacterium]
MVTVNPPLSDTLPVLDTSRLLTDFGDSPEVLSELRDLFLEHVAPQAEAIAAAVAAGDPVRLADQAHNLKGACSTYGALRLTAVCHALELAGKGGELTTAAALLPHLDDEIARLVEHLGAITAR